MKLIEIVTKFRSISLLGLVHTVRPNVRPGTHCRRMRVIKKHGASFALTLARCLLFLAYKSRTGHNQLNLPSGESLASRKFIMQYLWFSSPRA